MASRSSVVTNSPASVLDYQDELVRTGQHLPIGRMQKISIGYDAEYTPPANDKYIKKYGRMIELRDRLLPLAWSLDKSMLLVPAPLLDRNGVVELPDLPDPDFAPEPWSDEEIENADLRDPKKDRARMLSQRLRDRTSTFLEGTQIYVFQPVVRILFQPEIKNRMIGSAWWIDCHADASGTHCAFLVDRLTGQCHFFGGSYQICAPSGESTAGDSGS
jgi:hypothetical protein